MKSTVFLGSSTEGLEAARAIRDHLQHETGVTLWNQSLFRPSRGTLDTLLKVMERFDFAVLVFTADDIIESRGTVTAAPRDNVIFELGMCFGRLGPRRTFAACQAAANVKIPSDLAGITIPRFDATATRGDLAAAVQPLCDEILKSIRENASLAELRLLPSTALAIGYFENFILPVCTSGRVTIGARTWDLAKDEFKFIVLIPDEFGPTFHANLGHILREEALEHLTVPTASRSFPFYVQAGTDEGALQLYDIPTTMSVLPRAIRLHLGRQAVGADADERILQQREIHNFRTALQQLLDEPEHLRLRRIVEIRGLSSR